MRQGLESTGFSLDREEHAKVQKKKGDLRDGERDKTICYHRCTEKGDPKGRVMSRSQLLLRYRLWS